MRISTGCLLISGLFLAGCQTRTQSQPARTHPADETRIRALLSESAAAWNRGDLAGHLSIYVDSVTFMTASGPRPGVKPIEEAFTLKYFRDGKPKQTLGFDEVRVRFLGSNTALVTGRFRLTGGGEPEQSGWYTLVWIRSASGWKVLHDHSS